MLTLIIKEIEYQGMERELLRPVIRAIIALVLIALVKITATLTLIGMAYLVIDIVLSFAVIFVLFRFMQEFNSQIRKKYPNYPEATSVVSGIISLLIILTLYGTFIPFSRALPDGTYHIIFFILALIPIYYLWKVLYKNTERLSEIIGNTLDKK